MCHKHLVVTCGSHEIHSSPKSHVSSECSFSLAAPLVVPSARCVPEEQKLYKPLRKTACHVGQVIHIEFYEYCSS